MRFKESGRASYLSIIWNGDKKLLRTKAHFNDRTDITASLICIETIAWYMHVHLHLTSIHWELS